MASYDLTRIPALRDLQELGRRQKNVTDGLGQRVSALETNTPTKVSDLTNDKKYQTETEVSAAINKAVAAADHLKRKNVASTGNIDLKAADAAQYIYIQRISHPDDCSFFKRGKARIDGDNAGESRTIRRWTKRKHVLWHGGCLRCISYPDDRYRAEYCPT